MTNLLVDSALGATAVAVDDAAIIDALCDAETALARACARAGVIDLATAFEIAAVCDSLRRSDIIELARRSVSGGNPVIPLVEDIRAAVEQRAGADTARAVHLGATSQDIMDTALMLVAKRALEQIGAGLATAGDTSARLAVAHRGTAMAARTLLQLAVPTTFGVLAASWGRALDTAATRVRVLASSLPVQLGGAGGTLAALQPYGAQVRSSFADELDLVDPGYVWHTDRAVIADIAGVLGTTAAAVGKTATDLVLLAQAELGEVRERAPGGSSAMAHKQNPIAAVTARAAAMQVPGLAATLFAAAAPELQRGAGSWHAEWPALLAILRYSSGATARVQVALDIDVDAAAMRRNLARLEQSIDIADSAEMDAAHELVDSYLAQRSGTKGQSV